MKTENNILRKVNSAIALFAFLLVSFSSYSQCNLACNSNVQVSLDNDCSVLITPDMVLEGDATLGCTYTVSLEDAFGNPIEVGGQPIVNASNIDQTLTVKITDQTGNHCWGSITVEDKLAPEFNCPDDRAVLCYETVNALSTAYMSQFHLVDNCNNTTVSLLSDVTTDVGCNDTAECSDQTIGTAGAAWIPGLILDPADPNCGALLTELGFPVVGPVVFNYSIRSISITTPGVYNFLPTDACDYIFNVYETGDFDAADPCATGDLLTFGGYSALNGGVSLSGSAMLQVGTYDVVVCAISTACVDALPAAITVECAGISAKRTICYIAEDASGNVSDMCCYNVYYSRVSLYNVNGDLNIILPPDYDDSDRPALSCRFYSCDENSSDYPTIGDTGVPTNMSGGAIYPNTSYCEINATYSDQVIPLCGTQCKIIREWTLLDWCSGEVFRHNQILKIEDGDFQVSCPPVAKINVSEGDRYACTGIYESPLKSNFSVDYTQMSPYYVNRCSDWDFVVSYKVADETGGPPPGALFTTVGVIKKYVGSDYYYEIPNLPKGCNWIKYEFTDACGEVQSCTTEAYVIDDVAPNPVCDLHTTVTVGTNGWAAANAESFDDGSFDACDSPIAFGARRVNGGSCVGGVNGSLMGTFDNVQYYDYLKFCCSDIGNTVAVEMIVVDDANGDGIYGNTITITLPCNDRMVQCEVSDNWNVCTVEVEVQDVSGISDNQAYNCGSSNYFPTNSYSCSSHTNTEIIPVPAPTLTSAAIGGICYSYDIELVGDGDPYDFQDCGNYKFKRTWEVTKTDESTAGNSPVVIGTCVKTVHVNVNNNFVMSSFGWPSDRLNLVGCMNADTSPSATGIPQYNGGDCATVAHTYTDQVFNFVDGACFKILRTWTVIDWCQYSTSNPNGPGIWSHVQVIKINDNIGPNPIAETVEIDITSKVGCTALGTASIDGNDNCGDLTYSYVVQLQGDNATTDPDNDFPTSGNLGSNNSFTLNYWVKGTYTITWTVEDGCGNVGTVNQTVRVRDRVAPSPYCRGSVTIVLMESTGTVEIWANDFDLGTVDNCDGTNVTATFGNGSTGMTFDCDDLGVQTLQVYFTDSSGNSDFCTVEVDIQDNANICGGSTRIAGEVYNEMNEMLDDVEVMLFDMVTETESYDMTQSGNYAFLPITTGQDYKISASKDDDYMNGVSTLDLVLIQKHLLNIQPLNSPYKLMAADVNYSGNISASDLVELRKLILGIYTELPNNESWRFVDADQTFANVNQPWPFTEVISVNQINASTINEDFVAVKIGDVNNTAAANVNSATASNRTDNDLELVASYDAVGEDKVINITASNFNDIIGLQTTINIEGFEFVSIEKGAIELTHSNINPSVEGKLAISWNANEGITVDNDAVLFSLVLRAKTNNNGSDLITISSDLTKTEAYTSSLEVMNITLRNDSENATEIFEVFQNTPNPFSDETSISFNLPERASVTLTIYDLTGRSIKEWTNTYEKGSNTVSILQSDLNVTGVMYYRIDAGSHTATRKMISLK